MKYSRLFLFVAALVILAALGACNKTYFQIAEEANNNVAVRYTTTTGAYTMGKSIALTRGKFEIIPGDSVVLYIEGRSTGKGVGEESVAELELATHARFYVMLPNMITVGRYNTQHRAICEVVGSMHYQTGENLFICQSGRISVDSLDGSKIYGKISGVYLNTKNQTLTVEGDIKADMK